MESERGLTRAQERSAIQELARRLAALDPKTDVITDLIGLTAGALYSTDRAAELGFDDARATPDRAQFAAEFRATLQAREPHVGRVLVADERHGQRIRPVR